MARNGVGGIPGGPEWASGISGGQGPGQQDSWWPELGSVGSQVVAGGNRVSWISIGRNWGQWHHWWPKPARVSGIASGQKWGQLDFWHPARNGVGGGGSGDSCGWGPWPFSLVSRTLTNQ